MTQHSARQYGARQQPSRANTKDSWITIDWGDRAPPSHLHGVLDQIAGYIVRDPKLIQQGKSEWRKASAMSKDRKRRAARRRNGGLREPAAKSRGSSGHSTPKKSTAATGGFLSGLFGGSKKKQAAAAAHRPSRSGTLRRAMTTPGKPTVSSSANVRRRATDSGRPRR